MTSPPACRRSSIPAVSGRRSRTLSAGNSGRYLTTPGSESMSSKVPNSSSRRGPDPAPRNTHGSRSGRGPAALEPELAPDPNERIDLVRGRELVRGHEAGDGFRIQDAIASILRLRAVDDPGGLHFLEVMGEGGRRDRHLFQDALVRGVLPLHE